MISLHIAKLIATVAIVLSGLTAESEARPGLFPVQELLYAYPPSSQQTTVIRDPLGNQGTAYAYQQSHNGFSSSAVAVSRSDNSKTLAYLPAIAPAIEAHQPFLYDNAHYPIHHHPAAAYSNYHAYV